MIKLSAQKVLSRLSELSQNDWWFIGQRKWSAKLANQVLDHEARLRANQNEEKPDPKELGLVFLKDVSQIDEALILDCNRIYIFNQTAQLHVIQNEDEKNSYFLTETLDCCDAMERVHPLQIKPAKSQQRSHPFLFASLLGSLPDSNIKIKKCIMHKEWRFYHE